MVTATGMIMMDGAMMAGMLRLLTGAPNGDRSGPPNGGPIGMTGTTGAPAGSAVLGLEKISGRIQLLELTFQFK